MEPTNEVSQKHFVNRITPLSKTLAVIFFIFIPLITLYAGYKVGTKHNIVPSAVKSDTTAVNEVNTVTTSKTYINEELGFSVEIPAGWIVTYEDYYGSGGIYISSPDYAEEEGSVEALGGPNKELVVSQGARFTINQAEGAELDESISSPDAYSIWELDHQQNCSNCVDPESISISGQPGVRGGLKILGDFSPDKQPVVETISTSKNGREFTINFSHTKSTTEYESVLEDFIRTFKFTN